MLYDKIPTDLNFVEREKKIEEFWKKNDIFKKSMAKNEGGKTYTFYD